MLGIGDKKTTTKSSSLNIDSFIHTMKDDLSSNIKTSSEPVLGDKITSSPGPTISTPQSTPVSRSISSGPFLDNPFLYDAPVSVSHSSSLEPVRPETPPLKKMTVLNSEKPQKGGLGFSGMLLVAIAVLLLLSIIGGGYYYWITNQQPQKGASLGADEEKAPEDSQKNGGIVISPLSEKYFSDKPNYLSLDINTLGAEEIKKKIYETVSEVNSINSKDVFEFIIVDLNKNPVAFPIFSVSSSIKIPSSILSMLEEGFSFYTYNDEGVQRNGLAIDIKKNSPLQQELLRKEGSLIEAFSPLFLYEDVAPINTTFKNSFYNNIPIRYLNLPSNKSSSLDYAIYNDKFLVASSKNTLRIIIDKLIKESSLLGTGGVR